MATGAIVSVVWGVWFSDIIYEIVPGFAASVIVLVLVTLATKEPETKVKKQFDQASKLTDIATENEDVDFDEAAQEVKK